MAVKWLHIGVGGVMLGAGAAAGERRRQRRFHPLWGRPRPSPWRHL
ncbi:hypothetical protein JOS77_06825 [Chromobacterium haemolyticum]|nr:hypothetical protein JOS77_06825 [Chromobacterium haemolyticum]